LTFVVLLVLAALWAVVLLPPLLRARTGRSSDSIGDFSNRLGVLSRTGGFGRRNSRRLPVLGAPMQAMPGMPSMQSPRTMAGMPPMPPMPGRTASGGYRVNAGQRSAKRRRDVTLGLVAAAVVTLLFATVAHRSAFWYLQVLVDVLLVAYVAAVAYFRSLQGERAETVRYLQPRRAPELALQRSPEFALRRTGSS
jgi:hypothetical protein